jgi:hypothetical protein
MENASAKDAEQLITLGHNVCDALKAGNPQSKVIETLRKEVPAFKNASDPYAAAAAAGSIVGAAQYAYCPNADSNS